MQSLLSHWAIAPGIQRLGALSDHMPAVSHHTVLKASNTGVQSCQMTGLPLGFTPVPVRDSRRAEMRANTFSALSAKGWMMVSRSWYSRKRCVASALCQKVLRPQQVKALRLSGQRPL